LGLRQFDLWDEAHPFGKVLLDADLRVGLLGNHTLQLIARKSITPLGWQWSRRSLECRIEIAIEGVRDVDEIRPMPCLLSRHLNGCRECRRPCYVFARSYLGVSSILGGFGSVGCLVVVNQAGRPVYMVEDGQPISEWV
jgi:hypothetical protein